MKINIPPFLNTEDGDFLTKFKDALIKNNSNDKKYYETLRQNLQTTVGAKDYNNIIEAHKLIDKIVEIKEKEGGRAITLADFDNKLSGGAPTKDSEWKTSGAKPTSSGPTIEDFVTIRLKMKPNPPKYNPDTQKTESCYIYEYNDKVTQKAGPPLLSHLTIFLTEAVKKQPAKKKAFGRLHITVEMGSGGTAEKDYPRYWVMEDKGSGKGDSLTPETKATIKQWAADQKTLINSLS